MDYFEREARGILATMDVSVGGNRPHDIRVHDGRVYGRVLRTGRLDLVKRIRMVGGMQTSSMRFLLI